MLYAMCGFANPGSVEMASAGVGSASHAAGELFRIKAGISMVHLPCRGEADALGGVIAAEERICFAGLPGAIDHIRARRLRALGVTSAGRTDALPGIPAVADSLPGYEAHGWFGLGAPRDTPSGIVAALNGEVNAALADPGLKSRLARLGATPLAGSRTDFGRLVASETARWANFIRAANARTSATTGYRGVAA